MLNTYEYLVMIILHVQACVHCPLQLVRYLYTETVSIHQGRYDLVICMFGRESLLFLRLLLIIANVPTPFGLC